MNFINYYLPSPLESLRGPLKLRFYLYLLFTLWIADLSEGQEKDILVLRRNSSTRRPFKTYFLVRGW
jgi:hypothetical protein